MSNNVSQDYLKIQIIQTVLDSFITSKSLLNIDDFKCLMDHLSKESCQLLRKSDRCALLLKIIELDDNNSKYIDQIINLISQLPSSDIKFNFGCKVMEIVLKNQSITSQEEVLFKWMKEYVEMNPSKEMEFYSIKLAMENRDRYNNEHKEEHNDEHSSLHNSLTNDEEYNSLTNDDSNAQYNSALIQNNFLDVDEDLQKLKIFESFQM